MLLYITSSCQENVSLLSDLSFPFPCRVKQQKPKVAAT